MNNSDEKRNKLGVIYGESGVLFCPEGTTTTPNGLIRLPTSSENEHTIYYSDEIDLEEDVISSVVGGYFTYLDLGDGRVMMLNEEGQYKCKLNKMATEMFGFNIYGSILVLGIVRDDLDPFLHGPEG